MYLSMSLNYPASEIATDNLKCYTLYISMHILHTFFHTVPKVLTKRICLTIGSLLSW